MMRPTRWTRCPIHERQPVREARAVTGGEPEIRFKCRGCEYEIHSAWCPTEAEAWESWRMTCKIVRRLRVISPRDTA